MKNRIMFAVVTCLAILLTSAENISDAEKYQSTEMNANSYSALTQEGDVRVAFVGNSITLHCAVSKIGWTNNWGMAASARDKDYVHLVAAGLERKTGRKVMLNICNLAEFERNFKDYDLRAIDDLIAFEPEYLIVALGENVPALETNEERIEFQEAFARLLGRFNEKGRSPYVVVRGVFWPNDWKDGCMRQAAKQRKMKFVRADFGGRDEMKAVGRFAHKGVANHPGDVGMAAIAKAILDGFSDGTAIDKKDSDSPVDMRPKKRKE